MEIKEIEAMISLLDDSDGEVVAIVESKIKGLGDTVIGSLEREWERNSLNPLLQSKIIDLIHDLQVERLRKKLIEWKENESDDLLKGLFLVATYQFPDLDIAILRQEIKKIYLSIWVKIHDDMHPKDIIRIMNEVIFEEYKFEPNIKNFHSVSNSMFNWVLEQRKGNPVALSCIYILLAQMLNLPIYGVNLPSLFVLIYEFNQTNFYLNPFNRGQLFFTKDIDDYLKQMKLESHPSYYKACSNLEIIKRNLTNLSFSYGKIGETEKQDEVNQLIEIFDHKNYGS